ncbi:MAG: hypothetical protein KF819_35545 [Labilithrix sp.]|nr:hypothetical protein [Labilithrix sp.]
MGSSPSRKRLASLALASFGLTAAAAACNGLTGVGDLVVGSSNGFEDGGENDAAPLSSCGARQVCMPNEDGWSPILLVGEGRTLTCPASYPASSTLAGVPFGLPTTECRCSCAPVGGTCLPLSLDHGGNQCANATLPVDLPPDGGCVTLPQPVMIERAKLAPQGAAPMGCEPQQTAAFPPPVARGVCGDAVIAPSGCARGEACVGEAPATTDNCIVHDGDVLCPSLRFPRRIKLGASPNDTRACTGCTCATDGCAGTELTLYGNTNCGGLGSEKLRANGTCNLVLFPFGLNVRSAALTAAGGCRVATPSIRTGDITFDAPKTICCR